MPISFEAPKYLWGEAILTANFVLNRVPHINTFLNAFKSNLDYFKVGVA